ncbi:4-alpha-glucanotransferase [SAR92 clade bacterium H455]|uniref:4-alpha-glucanotransferase n=1 Tax=SAR92 clade bacterium H455 TaxID=2974818 RepID=A0ABY5TQE8_9GAMM|nr:4-alpha-glucanotransferase [SAR92 clade bacterium H455]
MQKTSATGSQAIFHQRRSGVLLPITALPGSSQIKLEDNSERNGENSGENNEEVKNERGKESDKHPASYGFFDSACRFIDWIAGAGFSIWQLLPLGPTHSDNSPYLCLSSLAGERRYIGLHWLQQNGLLKSNIELSSIEHRAALDAAHNYFKKIPPDNHRYREYQQFCTESREWLDDFALFMALRQQHNQSPWNKWPTALRDRHSEAIKQAKQQLETEISQLKFIQFLFFKQWASIRDYASQQGVLLFGDMPLFVAHDSADVWANRDYFKLTKEGQPQVVAGVPPDYFSAVGQYWGNPHYHWKNLQRDNFSWWIQRLKVHLKMFDLLRIDHFRGLYSAWEIPANSNTAAEGQWQEAPAEQLLNAMHTELPELPLVAEDLGLMEPGITALLDQFKIPGMAVLQFAFDGNADNPYLPENLKQNSVLYSGTHDNDTSLGWFLGLSEQQQRQVTDYLHCGPKDLPRALLEKALASVAQLVIIPLQDLLGLGTGHRTNTPGIVGNNWLWRFQWQQLEPGIAEQFMRLNRDSGRCN